MVPAATPTESCSASAQCNDAGRCVTGEAPASLAAVLGAKPLAVVTTPGGPPQTFSAQLTAFSQAAATASIGTKVRVVGRDGALVSCDATTFGAECTLTGWAFTSDGKRFNAARPVQVKSPSGTPDGRGEVELRVDATDSKVVVPANSEAVNDDGNYDGVASFPGVPGGVRLSGRVIGNYVVLRDPTRTLTADGTIVLDRTTANEAVADWLKPVGANATTPGISTSRFADIDPPWGGELTMSLAYGFGTPQLTTWLSLALYKSGSSAPECAVDADCAAGDVCPAALHVCVPSTAWTLPTPSELNQFEDPRSTKWWNAMTSALGNGTTAGTGNPAFATTGADLIESLMCTTTSGAGHLGTALLAQLAQPSRSGDLACVADANGQSTTSPGAIGLLTAYDRTGAASSDLLQTCLDDLDRAVSNDFAVNFAPTTGSCVNLARILPALRLLATGELNKDSQVGLVNDDIRRTGIFTRLVQQWASLTGFVASTGLSKRELDDVETPGDPRTELTRLLDRIDEGWAALLDKRVAPVVAEVVGRTNQTLPSYLPDTQDYRAAKAPLVYWPFNSGTSMLTDVVRNVQITAPTTAGCGTPAGYNAIYQTRDCAAYQATLPSDAVARLAKFRHETVWFSLVAHDEPRDPEVGGFLFATAGMAMYQRYDDEDDRFVLVIVHPTAAAPGYERVVVHGLGLYDDMQTEDTLQIVRDDVAKTYTVYRWGSAVFPPAIATVSYQNKVSGVLSNVPADKLSVLGGPLGADWYDGPRQSTGFHATLDDFAIFNSKLSQRDMLRFLTQRGHAANLRVLWPATSWTSYGTQDIATPLGASLRQVQSVEVDVAARLVQHMGSLVPAACSGSNTAERADLDAVAARIGRTLRQSLVVDSLLTADTSAAGQAERDLLWSKRAALIRAVGRLATCVDPYGLTEGEVPLYFSGISPPLDEKAAYFAPSDTMLQEAEKKSGAAKTALEQLRASWRNARTSEIQQLESNTARTMRIDDITTRYGDELRRLCGIEDQTAAQVITSVRDHTFAVDKCFYKTAQCQQEASLPFDQIDPTCYRGVIGAAALDIQTVNAAVQTAYQAWQNASDTAAAAQRVCILAEIDEFGCTALDRHELSDVSCPDGFEGTLALVDAYNQAAADHAADKGLFSSITHIVSGVAKIGVAIGIGIISGGSATPAIIGAGLSGASDLAAAATSRIDDSIEAQKRDLDAILRARSTQQNLRKCWFEAEQYQRAISTAQLSFREATSRAQSAMLAFHNAVAAANAAVLQAPLELKREETRPAIPIASNYWVTENLAAYKAAFEVARRYTYIALRATEYDMQDSYVTAQAGKPSRTAVLGAWSPDTLITQLQRMRDQTNTRKLANGHPPALGHTVFDLGAKVFGLEEGSLEFGSVLSSYARPVYSLHGEYLGQGVRFSLMPQTTAEAPTWRCGERIWRVNAGASGLPIVSDGTHIKLLKSNVFASRLCDGDGFQRATLRPSVNLLAEGGDPVAYKPVDVNSPANIRMVDFSLPDTFTNFKVSDAYLNGSSSELALEGLYGDYVLLFTSTALNDGLDLSQLHDFLLRFDFLSADNTPPTSLVQPTVERGPKLLLDAAPTAIVVP